MKKDTGRAGEVGDGTSGVYLRWRRFPAVIFFQLLLYALACQKQNHGTDFGASQVWSWTCTFCDNCCHFFSPYSSSGISQFTNLSSMCAWIKFKDPTISCLVQLLISSENIKKKYKFVVKSQSDSFVGRRSELRIHTLKNKWKKGLMGWFGQMSGTSTSTERLG